MNRCNECGISFATYWQYKDHMEDAHNGLNRPEDASTYECDVCGEEFYAEFRLIQHIIQEHPYDRKI